MKIDTFTAISINGYLADLEGSKVFSELSDENILNLRNEIRNKYNAILVGANTILKDNPSLLNTDKSNKRIIIDFLHNIPEDSKIFTNKPGQTIIITDRIDQYIENLKNKGVRITLVSDLDNLKEIIYKLEENGIKTMLIEGGSKMISNFLEHNLIDEINLVVFPLIINQGIQLFNIKQKRLLKLKAFRKISDKYIYLSYKC